MKDFDEENDIDIYILNNELSDAIIDIYHSFGKKVIGILHGVFLSSIFLNEAIIYRSWKDFQKLDAFVHIIPDDYWVYKKLDLIIQYIFQIYLIWKVKIYLLHL